MNLNINEILITFKTLIFVSILSTCFANSLYTANDSVIVLNSTNFDHLVRNQNGLTLVNFYLHWCPHCITFSNIWKQLAKDIKGWKSVVRVAAINCAVDTETTEFCQRHGILRFPRIRLFDVNAQNDDLGQHFEVLQSMSDLKTSLIDSILRSQQSFALNLNLFPISITSRNELFNTLPIDLEKHNLIFIEEKPRNLGAEIVLDFSSFREYVNIIRVNDRTGSLRDELFSHSLRLPSLIQMHRNQSLELIASANSKDEELLRREFRSKIKHLIHSETTTKDNDLETKGVNNSVVIIPRKPLPLALSDLYNTLRYSLHSEVIRYKILNTTQVVVLKKFFSINYKYFPFDNENVRRFFKRMNTWFLNKTKPIKVEDFRAAMKISDGYLPPIVQWRHCSGSRPHFRGYPCGLWSLFHVLTVREYVRNTSANSHEVLPLMRDFIINYFSCDYCAKHFENTSKRLSSYLDSPESSVLWLWRVHNQVNQRTKGSPSEDPYFPKVQYPSQHLCSQCYNSNSEFNETNVLQFLIETYDQKYLTKSAAYFADQKILTKNSVDISNPIQIVLILALISSLRYLSNF